MKPGEKNIQYNKNKQHIAERVVEQIATPRNVIVNLGFASVDNAFLGSNNLLYHPLSYVLFI